MKTIVLVTADTNDADYITEIADKYGTDSESIERLKEIIKTIKDSGRIDFYGIKWNNHEYKRDEPPEEMYRDILSFDDVEFLQGYLPYGEYGIHTIYKIRILKVEEEEFIL